MGDGTTSAAGAAQVAGEARRQVRWSKTRLHAVDEYLRARLPEPVYTSTLAGFHGVRRVVGLNPGRGRVLPDFVIIGAQKGGTTSLHAWLGGHPHVAASALKELDFFSYQHYRGADWYRRHFPLASERDAFAARHGRPFLAGEASPSYLQHPLAPGRMAKLMPDASLIVSLRDPVERAYSSFQMWRRFGQEPIDDFMTACALEDERLDGGAARSQMRAQGREDAIAFRIDNGRNHLGRMYLMCSRYAEQLERWLACFDREQLHVLTLEEMAADAERSYAAVLDFLGLSAEPGRDLQARFSGAYAPLADEDRERLRAYFRPHNERLYELLGRDLGW